MSASGDTVSAARTAVERRYDRLARSLDAFAEAGGIIRLESGENIARFVSQDEAQGLGLLRPTMAKLLLASIRTSLAEQKNRRAINELPNQYGKALETIPVLKLDRKVEWVETEYVVKAPSDKRPERAQPSAEGQAKLRAVKPWPWWLEVDAWEGEYRGSWTQDTKEPYLDYIVETHGKASLTGTLSLQRVAKGKNIWRGRLTGTFESKSDSRSTPKKLFWSDSVMTASGPVSIQVNMGVDDDGLWWEEWEPFPVKGRETATDADGTYSHETTWTYSGPGMSALLNKWRFGHPIQRGATVLSGSHKLEIDKGIFDSVQWKLVPKNKPGFPRPLNPAEKFSWKTNAFPNMDVDAVVVTGLGPAFNCMADTLGIRNEMVWPETGRTTTREALDAEYEKHGWVPSDDGDIIAVWGDKDEKIYHVSKVLPDGRHESKFAGGLKLIHSETDLEGGKMYPTIHVIYYKIGRRR